MLLQEERLYEIKLVAYNEVPVDVCKSVIKPQQKHDEQNNHQQP